jgi:hypothetical protein
LPEQNRADEKANSRRRLFVLQIIQLCYGPATGCAFADNGVCRIALPSDDKDDRLVALTRRHKIGHCNGWPAHYPGGRSDAYEANKRAPTYKLCRVDVTLY